MAQLTYGQFPLTALTDDDSAWLGGQSFGHFDTRRKNTAAWRLCGYRSV